MNAAGQAQQHRQRRIGDFLRAIIGHVGDGNSQLAAQGTIHIVEPHAATDDHPATLQPADGRFGQRQFVVQNDRVGLFDPAHQFGFAARVQGRHARQFTQHFAFRLEIVVDQVRNHHLIGNRHAPTPEEISTTNRFR
ncbi:MAG: hypothetical protein MUF25_29455 [Pirellulaceae bacterium]|nr:hypothetical protein [Pirellulaceae bacterium]